MPHARIHRVGAWLGVVAAVLLAGCGPEPAGRQPAATPETTTVPDTVPVDQPLTASQVIFKLTQGCTRDADGQWSCPPPAEGCIEEEGGCDIVRVPESMSRKTLVGFEGPYYADGVPADPRERRARVIEETVGTLPGKTWGAVGLVRNETTEPMPAIQVHARLLDTDGQTIEVVRATALVPHVRPGEPVPFQLTSQVETDKVAEVRWSADRIDQPPAERDVGFTRVWRHAYGQRGPRSITQYDPPGQTPPYLVVILATGMENQGFLALSGLAPPPPEQPSTPQVVIAWYDRNTGRVLRLERSTLRSSVPPYDPIAPDVIAPGGDAVFLEHDPHEAARLTSREVEIAIWGYMP